MRVRLRFGCLLRCFAASLDSRTGTQDAPTACAGVTAGVRRSGSAVTHNRLGHFKRQLGWPSRPRAMTEAPRCQQFAVAPPMLPGGLRRRQKECAQRAKDAGFELTRTPPDPRREPGPWPRAVPRRWIPKEPRDWPVPSMQCLEQRRQAATTSPHASPPPTAPRGNDSRHVPAAKAPLFYVPLMTPVPWRIWAPPCAGAGTEAGRGRTSQSGAPRHPAPGSPPLFRNCSTRLLLAPVVRDKRGAMPRITRSSRSRRLRQQKSRHRRRRRRQLGLWDCSGS